MSDENDKKLFLKTLRGEKTQQVPFWFMRQAGRYLPEYRELRKKAGSFLDMAYNPQYASEITMQPIRRFGMDGAILFSDILVIPHAMGQDLKFSEGVGPILKPVLNRDDILKLDSENIDRILDPVYDTVTLVRKKLAEEKFDHVALIGFAGSPWTVACYMVEGGSSQNFKNILAWVKNRPEDLQLLMDKIIAASVHYLSRQIEAGAEVLQLFDSWAGLLGGVDFENWVIKPNAEIIRQLRLKYPAMPIIGFPRKGGDELLEYARNTEVSGLGLDYSVDIDWAHEHLASGLPVQGNLHPEILLAGGKDLERAAHRILDCFAARPLIFNLGHGVIKETPPEHVAQLAKIVQEYRA